MLVRRWLQFVCNGLFWPDRTPHPAAFEVKHLQAPLAISLCLAPPLAGATRSSSSGGCSGGGQPVVQGLDDPVEVLVRSKLHFSNSAHLALSWRLLVNGQPASDATAWQQLALQDGGLGPQQEAVIGLGMSWRQLAQQVLLQGGHSVPPCIEVRVLLACDCLWAPAGHEVQTAQLTLAGLLPTGAPSSSAPGAAAVSAAPPRVDENEGGVVVAGSDWALHFDAASGGLVGWTGPGGRQLLAAPVAPCFYRAPTDNDKGGSGGSSYAARCARARGARGGCGTCPWSWFCAAVGLCMPLLEREGAAAGGKRRGWTACQSCLKACPWLPRAAAVARKRKCAVPSPSGQGTRQQLQRTPRRAAWALVR